MRPIIGLFEGHRPPSGGRGPPVEEEDSLIMGCRLRRIGGLVVASCAVALAAATSAGAALPSGYSADPPDGVAMPSTKPGDHFGTAVANLNGLILVGVPDANNGEGAIVFVNPTTGDTQKIS